MTISTESTQGSGIHQPPSGAEVPRVGSRFRRELREAESSYTGTGPAQDEFISTVTHDCAPR